VSLSLVAALAVTSAIQTKVGPVPKPTKTQSTRLPAEMIIAVSGTAGWSKTNLTPIQIASKMDQSLKVLKQTKGQYRYMIDTPKGRGLAFGDLWVPSQAKYRLEVPFIPTDPRDLSKQTIVSDGNRFGIIATGGWQNLRPRAQRPNLVSRPVRSKWLYQMGRIGVAGIGSTERPFADLVRELGPNGYRVTAEQRVLAAGTGKTTFYRILATKSGSLLDSIELTTVGTSWLPLNLRGRRALAAKKGQPAPKPVTALWTARWEPARPLEFDQKKFEVPKK